MLKFLAKTAQNIASILHTKTDKIDKDALEEVLIESDIDYDIIESLLDSLPKYATREALESRFQEFFAKLPKAQENTDSMDSSNTDFTMPANVESKSVDSSANSTTATLIIGVNGAGKTTTIAKLAKLYQTQGKSVLLGAGDTFRAAATQQLKLWGEKLGIQVISTQQGGDPSALAFDTIQSGIAKRIDRVIIDTAGRLHNQTNLKNELEKIHRICLKALQGRHLEKLLIIDGTQGSSALTQAKSFSETIDIDGVIVTKLDGTSKGGVIFSIIHELGIPVRYLGIGEREDDLVAFDKDAYIQGLLDCIFAPNEATPN
ncbi:signal recognition particle-docking protein FtsY [Helicobacter sp. CLO-3]|uniref:signal recognition particle-docking protein FtsY n=1 Tax=unclassified Helicobacter TaxID=2593540 RepID=UPI000804D2F7|nr:MULTISPECIES: signal recognition particle-docking protein FtsY [unclassified Helicobacter]OBV29024.1 signal recognition particle-docking protein FtsY [Helicobacter sp. CLO-3]OHU81714.1 signal recognition particle-docking protein FtsY [Helicobacter sp. CLO-3]